MAYRNLSNEYFSLIRILLAPNANVSVDHAGAVVALAGVVVMLYDSFFPNRPVRDGAISIAGLVVAAVLLVMMWGGDVHPAARGAG